LGIRLKYRPSMVDYTFNLSYKEGRNGRTAVGDQPRQKVSKTFISKSKSSVVVYAL
jgi:hypothetical protein